MFNLAVLPVIWVNDDVLLLKYHDKSASEPSQ